MTYPSTGLDRLLESQPNGGSPRSATRFELPALPFERHSLEPEISRAQIDLLYSHYHRRQLAMVNQALTATDTKRSLAGLAASPDFPAAAAAGEAWNLTFFWHSLGARDTRAREPLAQAVRERFGGWRRLLAHSLETITASQAAWCWLIASPRGELDTRLTGYGTSPSGVTPLLAVALTPDAYRLDFTDDRNAYVNALWPKLNWEYAALCWQVAVDAGRIEPPPEYRTDLPF